MSEPPEKVVEFGVGSEVPGVPAQSVGGTWGVSAKQRAQVIVSGQVWVIVAEDVQKGQQAVMIVKTGELGGRRPGERSRKRRRLLRGSRWMTTTKAGELALLALGVVRRGVGR
jgi:hypothetical protein